INTALKNAQIGPAVKSGREAAVKVVGLMRDTIETLPPQKVIDVYVAKKKKPKDMWPDLKGKTIEVCATGCKFLAMLWESAWAAGNGRAIPDSELKAIPTDTLMKMYGPEKKDTFARSMWLDDMVKAGIGVVGSGGTKKSSGKSPAKRAARAPART